MQDICIFCVSDHRIGTLLEQAHCADDSEAAAICYQDVSSHHENRFSSNTRRIENVKQNASCLRVCPLPKRGGSYRVFTYEMSFDTLHLHSICPCRVIKS